MMPRIAALIDILSGLHYTSIFLILALVGFIIPISEEVVIILVGYITSFGDLNVYVILPLSIAALFAGDSLLYWLSRRGNKMMRNLKKRFNQERINKYEELLTQHSGKTILFLRFIVGVRVLCPLLAGYLKVPYPKFVLFDLLALSVYAPILILLGYVFNHHIISLISQVLIIRHIIFLVVISFLGLGISLYVRKKFLKKPSSTS
jgi:membrane-associated protein